MHVHMPIVEDDPDVAELIEWALQEAENSTKVAATIQDASSLLGRFPFDPILLGINLPGGRAVAG